MGSRQINRLKPVNIARAKRPGLYADGGNLYLQISDFGTKSWVIRFTLHGRAREMGLGPLHTVTLAEAREKAREARKLLLEGVDPIEIREAKHAEARLEAAKAVTFNECAKAYIKSHQTGWKNAKHAAQWQTTLDTYAAPVFGNLPVAAVDTALVMKVLDSIWTDKPETATRLRARIERVLDLATVRGYREGDNPARWRHHLDKLLPRRSRVRAVKHHPALRYAALPAFMTELKAQEGTAARALEFLILTAARTSEVIGATWDEFNLTEKVWTVPAERMKMKKEHRVPLSDRALVVIEAMRKVGIGEFVFPGDRAGKHLSNMAMLALTKRMNRRDLVPHGFRSTFRDWAAERTNYPREVAEAALAHAIADKVEAAYRRGDLFEKRRRLMNEWARYCSTRRATAEVVALSAGG
jgi:integrase